MTLLNESLDSPAAILEIKDQSGVHRELEIDMSGLSSEDKQADMLAKLGITPFRPTVPAVIGRIESGGAAERDGLLVGDRILMANNKKVDRWMDWVDVVRAHPEKEMLLSGSLVSSFQNRNLEQL